MPQINPKFTFWFGVWTTFLVLVGSNLDALGPVTQIPHDWILAAAAVCNFLAKINNGVLTALVGLQAASAQPGVVHQVLGTASSSSVVKVIAWLVLAPAAVLFCLYAAPAHAQTRHPAATAAPAASSGVPQFQFPQLLCDPLKLIPNCKSEGGSTEGPQAQTADGFSNLLQEIYDKIHATGNALIADMNKAQSIASQKFPDGTMADGPSNQCLTAAIPVVQLIVNNQLVPIGVTPAAPATTTSGTTSGTTSTPAPPPQTPDGPVTIFVKVRVIVNALQDPSVQSGCAWLQSSINQAGTQGLANVLAGLVGLTKLGVSIPGVAL